MEGGFKGGQSDHAGEGQHADLKEKDRDQSLPYIQSSYLFLPHPPNEGLHKGSPGSSEMHRTELDAMSV